MFSTSTQRQHWMFADEASIIKRRKEANDEFLASQRSDNSTEKDFLTADESEVLLKYFERKLMDFCIKFKPPMPNAVRGTTFAYFKRFYLNNSVMDYHPKEILVTASYLACKVEEFNVSIEQFIANINGNKERATEVILNSELLLMQQLNFHLTVHNPYRPVEGLLIDIKARFDAMDNHFIEGLRPAIGDFLLCTQFTNASFVYAPSQLALAAVIHAASKAGRNLDSYVTDVLFSGADEGRLRSLIEAVRNIRMMVKNVEPCPDVKVVKALNDRLEKCRNQENNPDSPAYKRKIQEMFVDEDDRHHATQIRGNSSISGGDMRGLP